MNKAVIGLGFGDEGKGMFTDYLCSHNPDTMVVRFSGGHQCGHTVYAEPISIKHVFSNFGSGTLRGVPTYWSKECTVEPVGLINELRILLRGCVSPVIYIDDRCPITTPFEICSNRNTEITNKHGSCGIGFGATIQREEDFYSLRFIDLFYPDILKAKLDNIRKYYGYLSEEKTSYYLEDFLKSCDIITKSESIRRTTGYPVLIPSYNLIYEGSQGLLLDQNIGFFPNVTRSNTGSKNIPDRLEGYLNDVEYFLVTRAYQTRHGNGFMTNESLPLSIKENLNETNQTHEYQGTFRKSVLDVSLLEYAINNDEKIRFSNRKNLVITCLDQMKEWVYTYKGNLRICPDEKTFIKGISKILNIKKIYVSHGEDSSNISKVNLD